MSSKFDFKRAENPGNAPDSMHIDLNKGSIRGYLNIGSFRDKDTKQWVLFSPGLDLTSYGETKEKALEMMQETIHDFFKNLTEMSRRDLEKYLTAIGWKKHNLFNKKFSKAHVDINGELQNFNAEENSVERFALVA